MVSERKSQGNRARRPTEQPRGVRLAVAGCVVFGAGVLVGALLGPLAKPKTRPERPKPAATAKPSSKSSARPSPAAETAKEPEKKDPLTFFKTLKEAPAQSKEAYVPFNPKEEAPPPLEELPPTKLEAAPKPAEARPSEPEEAPREEAPQAPSRFYVRVAAFQFRENARRLTSELRQDGYSAVALERGSSGKPHQVRVGPYGSWKEALSVANRLEKQLLYPTSVLEETRP